MLPHEITVLRAARWLTPLLLFVVVACTHGDSGGAGGAGGGVSCGSCADAFMDGGDTCDGSATDTYEALSACACGPCIDACGGSICKLQPSDEMCGECLQMKCMSETMDCAMN